MKRRVWLVFKGQLPDAPAFLGEFATAEEAKAAVPGANWEARRDLNDRPYLVSGPYETSEWEAPSD